MKWCSSGMHNAPEAGGEWIRKKGTSRWQCATCKGNKKPPTRLENRAPLGVDGDRTDAFTPFAEGADGRATS